MRLKKLETGQPFRYRMLIALLTVKYRSRVPDVLRTLTYRPELYGRAYNEYIQAIMRGESGWSAGERELFAAFVSSRNQCPF